MGRWEPAARARLERAALELYAERGFDRTTVAEIAARAGLTERTFFRHFSDKREVLFGGAGGLEAVLVETVAAAPPSAAPIDVVAAAFAAAGASLEHRRDIARRRQAVIEAHPMLQERELIKLAALGGTLTAELRRRGVVETAAALAAETGVAVFKIAFLRWIAEENTATFAAVLRDAFAELKAVAAGR